MEESSSTEMGFAMASHRFGGAKLSGIGAKGCCRALSVAIWRCWCGFAGVAISGPSGLLEIVGVSPRDTLQMG